MDRLVAAQFERIEERADSETVTAILEPLAGGDVALEDAVGRHVIQFKHRSRSLGQEDLASSVLPDLFRAHCGEPADIYELQCTSALSKSAISFVRELSMWRRPGAPSACSPVFAKAYECCRSIHQREMGDRPRDFDGAFRTFLDRFTIGPRLSFARAKAGVLGWLRTRVEFVEDVEASFDQLVGYLLDRAQQNDAQISVPDLLAQLGLLMVDESAAPDAANRLAAALNRVLVQKSFDPGLHVRDVIAVNPNDTVTLVAGKSGRGKSWVITRLAFELNAAGAAVLLVQANTADELRAAMCREIALNALGFERQSQAAALGRQWRRRRAQPDAHIWILWEGCRDPQQLVDIIRDGGLGDGLLLVAEVPAHADLAHKGLKTAPLHRVTDFTELELFQALKRHGIDAGIIPNDIRRMLCIPILCGLYAQLASKMENWDPRTEYRVLDDFWEQETLSAGFLAKHKLKQCARDLLKRRRGDLLDADLAAIGFSDDELKALIKAGWLLHVGERWSFAHDRLLTWVVAKVLAEDLSNGALSPAQIAEQILLLQNGDENASMPRLGFILMDVVWASTAPGTSSETVAALLRELEAERRGRWSDLYDALLPTAGDRILPAVTFRITSDTTAVTHGMVEAFAACISGLQLPRDQVEALVRAFWESGRPGPRAVAVALCARWPVRALAEEMWQAFRDAVPGGARFDSKAYERLHAALEAISVADPEWLETKLLGLDPPDELALAARLMSAVGRDQAEVLWTRVRFRLFERVPLNRQKPLLDAVERFWDEQSLDRVEALVCSDTLEAATALGVIAKLDPGRALVLLDQRHPALTHLPPGRQWLDRLLDHAAIEPSLVLGRWLQAIDDSGRMLANLWSLAPDRIDPASLRTLLECLSDALSKEAAEGRPAASIRALLASPRINPAHVATFASFRHTALSKSLVQYAETRRAAIGGRFDVDETYTRSCRLLRLIGGPVYEAFILRALEPAELGQAHPGILLSQSCDMPAVVTRLEELAQLDVSSEDYAPVIDVWRSLLALSPARWRPRLLDLLDGPDETAIKLGLFLLEKYGHEGDQQAVIACLNRSPAGSDLEVLAMNRAALLGPANPAITERALVRFTRSESGDARDAVLNTLLNDPGERSRTALDEFLAPLETARSWSSTQIQALEIRLSKGDADERLWRAAERLIERPTLFGHQMIDSFAEKFPGRAKNILIKRCFAPPSMLTSAQPNAIRVLARNDPELAERAFVLAWTEQPERRKYLAEVADELGEGALQAIVEHIHEDIEDPVTFRAACLALRRRQEQAMSIVPVQLRTAHPARRRCLCEVLGWMPDTYELLMNVAAIDNDKGIGLHAYEVARGWRARAEAVEGFRREPSLEALEHVIELVDPAILIDWDDPWRIVETIQASPSLMMFAETALARRLKKVQGTNGPERVRIHPHHAPNVGA